MAKKPLILAIERDSDQARLLSEVIHRRLRADLVLAETVERAMTSLGKRVPNLVLIPTLLSPREEGTLRSGLRANGADHVQMLMIPVLAPTTEQPKPRGVLSRFRRDKSQDISEAGFSPSAFAEQIAEYLENKADPSGHDADQNASGHHEEPVVTSATAPASEARATAPVDEVQQIDTAEPFDLALRMRGEGPEPSMANSSAAAEASHILSDAAPMAEGILLRATPETEPTGGDALVGPDAAARIVEEARPQGATDAPETFAPIEIALLDENADWAAVMESLRDDLDARDNPMDAPVATDLAPTAPRRAGGEGWGGMDPLESGFPTLLARLQQLMEDTEQMVA